MPKGKSWLQQIKKPPLTNFLWYLALAMKACPWNLYSLLMHELFEFLMEAFSFSSSDSTSFFYVMSKVRE